MTAKTAPSTFRATLLQITREHNSRNGNPRFQIIYRLEDGRCGVGFTAPDAAFAFAYEIGNPGLRELDLATITGHGLKSGVFRITDVAALAEDRV